MRYVATSIVVLVMFGQLSCVAEAPDHWSRIKQLSNSKARANPQLLEYLKSLSKDQTLAALRQFGKEMETTSSVENWPESGLGVAMLMHFYPEPLRRSDLSDEEFRNMKPSRRREFDAGLMAGRLSDEAFDKLVAGIANKKEGVFFRWALAGYAGMEKERIGPLLNGSQRDRLLQAYLTILTNRESPDVVRRECYGGAQNVLAKKYRLIVFSDDAVKELMRTGAPEQRRELDSLLESGDIKLSKENAAQFAAWKQWRQAFRKAIAAVSDDEHEPASLREWAKMTLDEKRDRTEKDRVAPGGLPPGAPTDPNVRN